MPMCHRVNEYQGTVVAISKNKAEITIQTAKGSKVKAKNEGFEIGDKICFLLDIADLNIVKVMSRLTADLLETVGSDPTLQAVIEGQPEDLEQDFNEFKYENEETTLKEGEDYGCGDEIGEYPDEGQS